MAFPAVTDLVKGPIDESLKKLVQPAAIVPATVFLLLNLAVVYPRLLDAEVGAATAFKDLEDTWKAVILLVWILVSGYVLLNLNGSMLRLATGELIAETPVVRALQKREQARIAAFRKRLKDSRDRGDHAISAMAMDTKLPREDKAAPTRLGNVFAGASRQLIERYGFDIAALWTPLRLVLSQDHKDLGRDLVDAKSASNRLWRDRPCRCRHRDLPRRCGRRGAGRPRSGSRRSSLAPRAAAGSRWRAHPSGPRHERPTCRRSDRPPSPERHGRRTWRARRARSQRGDPTHVCAR